MKSRSIFLPISIFCLSLAALNAQRPIVNSEGDAQQVFTPIDAATPSGSADVFRIAAGDEVEGDFHTAPAFEPEGGECWVAHRTTNNISIVDVSQGILKTTISTGASPMDIVFTSQYGLVTCYGSDEVQVWDWRADTLVATIQTVGQPAKVEVSGDGSTAAVSLELLDAALVINLDDFSTTMVDDFSTGLSGFSFITSNSRNLVNFSGFDIAPNGAQLANGAGGPLKFYDLMTGGVDSIPEIQNAIQVKYTDDGTKLVAVVFGSSPGVYQVDVASLTIIKQIFPDDNVNSFYGELAMTPDGNRVLLPATNAGWLIRFDQDDFLPLTTTSAVFWTDIVEDGSIGIAGGYNTHMVDMTTGIIQSTTTGISLNMGAVAPAGDYMLAMDPLRRERAEMYVLGAGIFDAGPIQLGSELEADATYSTLFTNDGKQVLCVNSLSGTVSVINTAEKALEGIAVLDNYEIYHASLTPDDQKVFVGERLADQVSVIDLDALEVENIVYSGGDRPDQTFVHPSGEKVYVLNAGSTDAIGVLDISGADPKFSKSFPSGNTGISWTNRGIRCNLAITPDGTRGVLATPFDDEIQIIDLVNDEIMTSLIAEGFPLQTALSDPIQDRVYAAVTLKNDSKVYIIEDVLGTPIPFGGIEVGGNPTRIAYDPSTERFAVCSQDESRLEYIDPLDFDVVGFKGFSSHLTPISVLYSEDGKEFVLLQSNDANRPNVLQVDGDEYEVGIAPGHYFDILENGNMAAVPSIHEDAVYLVDLTTTSDQNVYRIPTKAFYDIGPNPFTDHLTIRASSEVPKKATEIRVFDLNGKMVFTAQMQGAEKTLQLGHLSSGSYQFVFYRNERIIQRSITLKQ